MSISDALKKRKSLLAPIANLASLVATFLAVYYLAFWLRFEGQLGAAQRNAVAVTIGWVAVAKLVVFWRFRMHLGPNRYLSFQDLVVLGKAATISLLVLALGRVFLFHKAPIPRSVLLIDWGATMLVVGGIWAAFRFATEFELPHLRGPSKTPVLILGDNDAGEVLLRTIRRNRDLNYRVIGFISTGPVTHPRPIAGVPVVGAVEQTCQLAKKLGVTQVLMTADELPGQQVRALVEEGRKCKVEVKVLPSIEQLLRGTVGLRLRTVSIEDLLRRTPVRLHTEELHQWIDDKVVLVTGSAGSIGSEICRQLLAFSPAKLVLVDQAENGQFFLGRELRSLNSNCRLEVCVADVTDGLRMNRLFKQHKPDVVFHAAAYKHVPLMETNVGEAVKNIALATRHLADIAHQNRVECFVLISTDKAVRPSSVMGACKRVAELYIQALAGTSDCRFVTVRFGNVLDSAGSVTPIFRQQIESGGPVTVTHPDMRRYFMTIREAAQLVIQGGALGRGGDVLLLDMGPPVRIVDLAEDMIRLSGLEVGKDIEIQFVGPRPGEKLFEQLQGPGEQRAIETAHPKIAALESRPGDLSRIKREVDELALMMHVEDELIRNKLHVLVPDFRGAGVTPCRRERAG